MSGASTTTAKANTGRTGAEHPGNAGFTAQCIQVRCCPLFLNYMFCITQWKANLDLTNGWVLMWFVIFYTLAVLPIYLVLLLIDVLVIFPLVLVYNILYAVWYFLLNCFTCGTFETHKRFFMYLHCNDNPNHAVHQRATTAKVPSDAEAAIKVPFCFIFYGLHGFVCRIYLLLEEGNCWMKMWFMVLSAAFLWEFYVVLLCIDLLLVIPMILVYNLAFFMLYFVLNCFTCGNFESCTENFITFDFKHVDYAVIVAGAAIVGGGIAVMVLFDVNGNAGHYDGWEFEVVFYLGLAVLVLGVLTALLGLCFFCQCCDAKQCGTSCPDCGGCKLDCGGCECPEWDCGECPKCDCECECPKCDCEVKELWCPDCGLCNNNAAFPVFVMTRKLSAALCEGSNKNCCLVFLAVILVSVAIALDIAILVLVLAWNIVYALLYCLFNVITQGACERAGCYAGFVGYGCDMD